MDQISLQGSLMLGGAGCSPCGGAGSTTRHQLALRCGAYYPTVVDTVPGAPISLRTGQEFVDIDLLGDLLSIDFLYVRASQPVIMRVGAAAPLILSAAASYPTGFVGSETLIVGVGDDAGVDPVTTTFASGDQSIVQVIARINAAFALAGYSTPRAVLVGTNQIAISGPDTGPREYAVVTNNAGAVALGLAGLESIGAGADVPVAGTFLAELTGVSRVQFSGVATLEIVAGGRSSV